MEIGLEINYFVIGLCTHCASVKDELQVFGSFHDKTEDSWKNKDTDLQDHITGVLKNHPKTRHEDIVDSFSWDLHQNQYKYPDIHRKSLIITIFSFLETRLNELCSILEECIELKIKRKDLNGRGIERAISYLKLVAEFDLEPMNKEVFYVRGVNQVRNQIVHNYGRLPDDDKHKACIFVTKAENLSGAPGGVISVRPDFIREFVDVQTIFFDKLNTEVERFIQSKNP